MEGRGSAADGCVTANLSAITAAFSRCRPADSDGMSTDDYLGACNELIRLFNQLGGGLGLALRGVDSAVKVLEIKRVSGAGCHYQRLEWMLRHESEQTASGRDGGSGTMSLITLQAALAFMITVLEHLERTLARKIDWDLGERIRVYESTIGRQHSLLIQTAVKAGLALGAARGQVMKNLTISYRGDQSMQHLLHDVIRATRPVHQKVEAISNYTLPCQV